MPLGPAMLYAMAMPKGGVRSSSRSVEHAAVSHIIEHIFGFITNSMHGITIRSIGITRAWFNIGLTNLIYNFCRYEFLKRPKASKG